MANSSGLCMVVATLIISALMITSSPYSVEASGVYSKLDWLPLKTSCQGTIAECLGGKEFDMDSESNRRILATTDYISYRALQSGNSVPCSQRGTSYYNNCQSGGQANPYNRGCSKISQCRTS